ncbi:MAG: hypothetical protein JWR26_70 [Pedosphaera sp.]|nr:hypothetical protein [Pedosphaera sp.]
MARTSRRFETRDILLKRMGFALSLIPTWVAMPIALGGSVALYNFWTMRLASTPPLNLFGFMFAGICVFAALVAGVRELERRNREAKFLRRRGFQFDSPPVPDGVGSIMAGLARNGAGRHAHGRGQPPKRAYCKQTMLLRMGGKTHFSRNVGSGCVNSPVCKYHSDSRFSRHVAPKSHRRSHSGEASAE